MVYFELVPHYRRRSSDMTGVVKIKKARDLARDNVINQTTRPGWNKTLDKHQVVSFCYSLLVIQLFYSPSLWPQLQFFVTTPTTVISISFKLPLPLWLFPSTTGDAASFTAMEVFNQQDPVSGSILFSVLCCNPWHRVKILCKRQNQLDTSIMPQGSKIIL